MSRGDPFRLDGKNAVVVGASKGIGRAVALLLARQGANVLLASRDMEKSRAVEREIALAGGVAAARALDAADPGGVERFFAREADCFGGVDILVYNAGFTIRKPFMHSTLEDFDRIAATNVKGAIRCLQLGGERMIRQGRGGSMVVVSSVNAVSALPEQALYSSTKAMLDSLVESAAVDLAPYGIRVNSLQPGAVWTDMNPGLTAETAAEEGGKIALGYVALPEDIAGAAVFLCTEAARYVCGAHLLADGGLLLRKQAPPPDGFAAPKQGTG